MAHIKRTVNSWEDLVYDRMELVMDKIKKMQEAEQSLAAMKEFETEYLKK
jgi:type III secretory pathway lipoprotein EscJ